MRRHRRTPRSRSMLSWKVNFIAGFGRNASPIVSPGRERRRAENDEAARLRKIGRHFESDMAAKAPADETEPHRARALRRPRERRGRAQEANRRSGLSRRRIRRGPEDRPQPAGTGCPAALELSGKGARRRRIAVDEHHRRTLAGESWTAIAPFGASIFCVFIDPSKSAKNLP